MQKIQADPKDVTSLQALADIYFLANEFETAGGFLEKILTVDAQDLTARLALGAVLFNIGQPDDAEDQWRAGAGHRSRQPRGTLRPRLPVPQP